MTDFAQPDAARHPDGVHRDQWDRPIIINPEIPNTVKCTLCKDHVDGWPYARVTKFISVLDDEFLLKRWMKRQTLRGALLRPDLVLEASSAVDDNKKLDGIVEKLMEAAKVVQPEKTPDRGSAVHALTELADRGELPANVPPDARPDLEAYTALVAAAGLTYDATELTIVIDGPRVTKTARGISGRFDRSIKLPRPCPTCGGLRRIGDVKTGTIDFGEHEFPMQLGTYASGKVYNAGTGERFDLNACTCVGYIIHVPAGKGEASLYRADLTAAMVGIRAALDVWQWRQAENLLVPILPGDVFADLTDPGTPEGGSSAVPEGGSSLPPAVDPSPGAGGAGGDGSTPDIHGLIAIAAGREDMASLYDTYGPDGTNDWAYGHTVAANRRLLEIEGVPANA